MQVYKEMEKEHIDWVVARIIEELLKSDIPVKQRRKFGVVLKKAKQNMYSRINM